MLRVSACAGFAFYYDEGVRPAQNLPSPASLRAELSGGAGVGGTIGLAAALAGGLDSPLLGAIVLTSAAVGALLGLLLWCERADIPEEPLLPVRGDNERYE